MRAVLFTSVMKRLISKIKEFSDGISKNNINAHAAASAFYMFLSLVPFIALLSTVLPYTKLSQDRLFSIIYSYIPDALQSIIVTAIHDIYLASDAVLPISVVLTIWLSSRAFSALIRGIEDITDSPRYSSYLRRSLLACLYTIGIITAMLILLVLLVFGEKLAEYALISPFVKLLFNLRLAFAAVILTLIFLLIYHWVPGMKQNFRSLVPGSAAAAAAWLIFTWLYSLYLKYGGDYSTYGSLAAIVISLLWMYWCMYIVLIGAYFNVFLYRKKHTEN